MLMPAALSPFRVRSFRFQWPADLLISWAFAMEMLIRFSQLAQEPAEQFLFRRTERRHELAVRHILVLCVLERSMISFAVMAS